MAIPAVSQTQIDQFLERIIDLPPELDKVEGVSLLLAELKATTSDPAIIESLEEAEVIIELKRKQAETAKKVQLIYQSLFEFQKLIQSNPKIEPSEYASGKKFLEEVKKQLDTIKEEDFPSKMPKSLFTGNIKRFEQILSQSAPGNWKYAVLERIALAGTVMGILSYASASANLGYGPGAAYGLAGTVLAIGVQKSTSYLMGRLSNLTLALLKPTPAAPPKTETDAPKLPIRATGAGNLKPSNLPLPDDLHANKKFVYDHFTQGIPPSDVLDFTKIELTDPQEALKTRLFKEPEIHCSRKAGPFAHPASTESTIHWTADFADPQLLGFVGGPLLAQEELLAAEHPALYHLKEALKDKPTIQNLEGNQAALIKDVKRYGAVQGIYGNAFAEATTEQLLPHLTRFEEPTMSNIFAIAAPALPGEPGKPYNKQSLQDLFLRSYTAFKAIKIDAEDKRAVVHTGNWGAGAFGGSPLAAAICQLAAARSAGIDISYYPMNEGPAFAKAFAILKGVEKKGPHLSVDQLLNYLAKHAEHFGIRYQAGNGT